MQQLHATLSVQWVTMLPSGGNSRQPSPGRVSTNVFLRDLVSQHSTAPSWRSIPLSSHSYAQTVSRTDVARMRVASHWKAARHRKVRAQLVVLAGEIGGRFSEEAHTFIRFFARAKVRGCTDGAPCWLAPRVAHSLRRCSIAEVIQA